MKRLGWGLIASLALLTESQGAEPTWWTDLAKAQEKAKVEKKMVLMDFTGSNWCPTCKALHKRVLTAKEFTDFAKDNLVLVLVDFPQPNSLSEAQQKANDALARRFKVDGYPTIILLDSYGKPLSKSSGYEGESAKDFVADLKKLKK